MFKVREAFANSGAGAGGSSSKKDTKLKGNVQTSKSASTKLKGNTATSKAPTSRRVTNSRLAGNV